MLAKSIPESIRHHITYDPETGAFSRAGKPIVGRRGSGNYQYLLYAKRYYPAHRVAWYLETGEQLDASLQIDHINHDPSDNRWINLRAATVSQNQIYKTYPVGPLPRGVYAKKHKYAARIHVDGRKIHLGYFKTADAASEAYQQSLNRIHGAEWNISSLAA